MDQYVNPGGESINQVLRFANRVVVELRSERVCVWTLTQQHRPAAECHDVVVAGCSPTSDSALTSYCSRTPFEVLKWACPEPEGLPGIGGSGGGGSCSTRDDV